MEGIAVMGFVFGMVGVVALVRLKILTKMTGCYVPGEAITNVYLRVCPLNRSKLKLWLADPSL